jgi:cytochrome c-type biogenesis protein CcmH
MGKRQVIDFMTATYGEQVLAAPTKKGFNLTAWITPFALLLVGAVSIWFVVLAWVDQRRGAVEAELAVAASEDLESKYGSVLERELMDWET